MVSGAYPGARIRRARATNVPRAVMKIAVIVSLGIGGTLLCGSAPNAAEPNVSAPMAAAPIPLVPEAYTASSAPVAPAAFLPSAPVVPTVSPPSAIAVAIASPPVETRVLPPPAPAIAAKGQVAPAPVAKFNQYHPHWVVDLH